MNFVLLKVYQWHGAKAVISVELYTNMANYS
jgi:hypothetical protein